MREYCNVCVCLCRFFLFTSRSLFFVMSVVWVCVCVYVVCESLKESAVGGSDEQRDGCRDV